MLEGLEVSEVSISKLFKIETFRFDSDYFQKKYIEISNQIKIKSDKFTTFGELNLKIDASAFYPSLEPFYNVGEVPFIRVTDVDDFIDYSDCVKIPQSIILDKAFKTLNTIDSGDIVITKGGSVGRVALIDRYTAVTRDLIFINSSKLSEEDYIFLYLYLMSDFAYSLMIQSSSMTAQPHLTLTLIKDLPIYKPSIDLKKVLSVLYNKITYLRNQSQFLYSQAEELLLEELGLKDWQPSAENINEKSFKESFLSTGRLDAEYYQPKYDEIIDIITNNNNCFLLKDYFNVLSSASPSKYQEDGIAVVKTKNVRIPTIDFDRIIDYTDTTDLLIGENDLLFASMGVGSLGRMSYIHEEIRPSTIDGTLKLFRIKEVYANSEFEIPTLLFLTSKIGQELIYKYIIGSTGIISISKDSIENLRIPIVDIKIRKQLTNFVNQSIQFKKQSEHLLEVAKRAVEIAIDQSEEIAMEYMKKNTK